MDRDQMRASESDRQLVMDQLRQAVEDGRLDVAEYQLRVDAAMSAKVYSELDVLLADLKKLPPPGYQDWHTPQATAPMPVNPASISKVNQQLRAEAASERPGRWRIIGVSAAIAAAIAVVLIVVWPELLLYIAIGVLAVLVMFILAAVLGLF